MKLEPNTYFQESGMITGAGGGKVPVADWTGRLLHTEKAMVRVAEAFRKVEGNRTATA